MIGRMRHRVVVQSVTATPTATGGSTEAWATVGTYWADVKQVRADRMYRYQQITEGTVFEVRMRYLPALDFDIQTHRLQYQGQEIVIHSRLVEKQRQAYIVFTCVAKGFTPANNALA